VLAVNSRCWRNPGKNREKGREKSPFGKMPQITKYYFLLQILADIKQKIVI